MSWTDEEIRSMLRESMFDGSYDPHAVVERMCDSEFARGEYGEDEVELAWHAHESRVARILKEGV